MVVNGEGHGEGRAGEMGVFKALITFYVLTWVVETQMGDRYSFHST